VAVKKNLLRPSYNFNISKNIFRLVNHDQFFYAKLYCCTKLFKIKLLISHAI